MPSKSTGPLTADRVTLYYRQGSSDKIYQAAIEPWQGGFVVTFAFGRRGSTLQTGRKTEAPIEYEQARKVFQKLIAEKTAKGYTPGEDGTPYQQTDKEQRRTGVLPQLLNRIEEEQIEHYLSDELWWMQEKFDGKRLLVLKQAGQVTAINRSGLSIGISQAIAAAVLALKPEQCLLDGEAVGEVYQAFDLLEQEGTDLRQWPYCQRYPMLVDLIDAVASNRLRYAETATDAGQKASMLRKLRRQKREGVVFKDQTASYIPGRPASGGSQLKLKFYATASCVVAQVNSGRRSVGLELIDGSRHVPVGNLSIPANQPVPDAGTIVEVRYLYAFEGGSLYQPVYLCRRDDVARQACRLDQLKLRNREEE